MISYKLQYKDANGNKYTQGESSGTMQDTSGNSFTVDNTTVVMKSDYHEPWVGTALDTTFVTYNQRY